MNKNLQSPTKLTEFAPLHSEVCPDTSGFSFARFFKLKRSVRENAGIPPAGKSENEEKLETDAMDWHADEIQDNDNITRHTAAALPTNLNMYDGDAHAVPNIIKRLGELLATKNTTCKEADLKQYWMPDSLSKECFECCDRFTTFRRRHHCRVCGRIFCSRCCNKEIPGKIMGYTGDLRVCTQCCKDVLAYLQSSNASELSCDLHAIEVDLWSQLGGDRSSTTSASPSIQEDTSLRRKSSVGYLEERFALGSKGNDNSLHLAHADPINELSPVERKSLLQDSVHLRSLMIEICKPETGMPLQTHRHRLRTFHACFIGAALIDWLMSQGKAASRSQAISIGQMLIDAGFLECIYHGDDEFVDGYVLYRPQESFLNHKEEKNTDLRREAWSLSQEAHEPQWLNEIGMQDEMFIECESDDTLRDEKKGKFTQGTARLSSASSMFYLELNVEENTVAVSKAKLEMQNSEEGDEEKYRKEDTEIISDVAPPPHMVENDSSSTEISDDFLKETLLRQLDSSTDFTAVPGWYNSQCMQKETGEVTAFESLSESYAIHERTLLMQLLTNAGLSSSWAEIILPLVHRIVEHVKPDVKGNNDDMDIRQYIQFKKISGGNRKDSCIVNGVVCSKNVAHRAMPSVLVDPHVLLLASSIIYQRIESKFLSLEPLWMQEGDYLKNAVARILALKPDILIVEKTVSRIALEALKNHKITLVLNVKPSVMERIARCTQTEILPSLDAHIGEPHLGLCHRFSVRNFVTDNGTKPLMFFEGCAAHLGCTVLLRGGSFSELKRVKRVMSLMTFVAHNWRLERSFLMDECALPPLSAGSLFAAEEDGEHDVPREMCAASDHHDLSYHSTPPAFPELKTEMCEVRDFSDPLHSYLQSYNEEEMPQVEENLLSMREATLPLENSFRKALDDVVLSTSPFMKFTVPFLETEAGRHCPVRRFLPDEIYWSKPLRPKIDESKDISGADAAPVVVMKPAHPFVNAQLTMPVSIAENEALLASYRAQGGRFVHKDVPLPAPVPDNSSDIESSRWEGRVDTLDPHNHQRFSVLFCSYSPFSVNAPFFCVNPWVVTMDLYGRNDIPLGCFLERFCFRPTYTCPSKNCETPMVQHVRRFAHKDGCIHIVMKQLDKPVPYQGDTILTWSWCRNCTQVSPIMPLSVDSWSLSFAKYLELRFHGCLYTRRGGPDVCSHSLHHEHNQYFYFHNIVAAFKYTNIKLWEVNLPPPVIAIKHEPISKDVATGEMRDLSVKGAEVFAAVQERLHTLREEMHDKKQMSSLLDLVQSEHMRFKSRIEEMQLKLTSPVIDSRKLEGQSKNFEKDYLEAMWDVEDCIVSLKYLISDAVVTWNQRIQELINQRRKEEKLIKHGTKAATVSKPAEVTRVENCDDVDMQNSSTDENITDAHPSDTGTVSNRLLASQSSVQHGGSDSVLADSTVQPMNVDNNDDTEDAIHTEKPLLGKDDMEEQRSRHSSGSSARGHERSYSDSRLVHTNKPDDIMDMKIEKRPVAAATVKTLLSQFLSGSVPIAIQSPLQSVEHYAVSPNPCIPVVIYEDEPTSVIAYTLCSAEYERQLQDIRTHLNMTRVNEREVSPMTRRKSGKFSEKDAPTGSSEFGNNSEQNNMRRAGVLSFLRSDKVPSRRTASKSSVDSQTSTSAMDKDTWAETDDKESTEFNMSKDPCHHVEVQCSSATAKFYCRVYYAEQFRLMRKWMVSDGEEHFVRSLLRCVAWAARGGKSGSQFCKTVNDRFILKQMSRFEIQSFVEFASHYFQYMQKAYADNKPTALAKILGVYRIGFKNTITNNASKMDVLIMENLFYGRNIVQKFDLKGSMRNRLVNTSGKHEGELVLLDENLLKMGCESPLYIRTHSKTVLSLAMCNDAQFLASHLVMDYSLLVGLDEEKKELVVGIIDYIRTFTWDKRLENFVKSYGILGGQSKMPTVVDPEIYQTRFCEAMDKYFLMVPDRWSGLGKGVDC